MRTVLEILVVPAIIGILVVASAPAFASHRRAEITSGVDRRYAGPSILMPQYNIAQSWSQE